MLQVEGGMIYTAKPITSQEEWEERKKAIEAIQACLDDISTLKWTWGHDGKYHLTDEQAENFRHRINDIRDRLKEIKL